MKRYSLIICMVLILSLSGVASAQVVLGSPATGGPATLSYKIFGTTFGPYTGMAPNTYVGHTSWTLYIGSPLYTTMTTIANAQAVFEFNLGPVIPPGFTSNSFTAKLDNLNVTSSYAYYGPGAMNVDLFDMDDNYENGIVYANDFNRTRGSRIARRTHTFGAPPVLANFNDIHVTDAVRNDLFGAGQQTDFSGFILKSPDAQNQLVAYDPNTLPTLTITTGVSPPILSDLAVSKTVNDTTPDEGQTITYTITLTNNGPNQATTVSITDLLPAGVTYSSDDGGGLYNSGTGVWTVGTINSSSSATLNIQATVDAGTAGSTITNSVTAVSLDQTDSNATGDDLSEAITVNSGGGGGGGGGGCFIVNAAR